LFSQNINVNSTIKTNRKKGKISCTEGNKPDEDSYTSKFFEYINAKFNFVACFNVEVN